LISRCREGAQIARAGSNTCAPLSAHHGSASKLTKHSHGPISTPQPLYDRLYAAYQDTRWSAREIEPFIRKYHIDMSEFEPVCKLTSSERLGRKHAMNFVEANGAKIPAIGLGTMTLMNAVCVDAVETALCIGYRHIDTAERYRNETGVGEGLRRGLRAAGIARDEWSRWNVSLRLAVAPAWPAEPVGVAQPATRRMQARTPLALVAYTARSIPRGSIPWVRARRASFALLPQRSRQNKSSTGADAHGNRSHMSLGLFLRWRWSSRSRRGRLSHRAPAII
jgi:hypothetical protein